jgi:hypothetical protein
VAAGIEHYHIKLDREQLVATVERVLAAAGTACPGTKKSSAEKHT